MFGRKKKMQTMTSYEKMMEELFDAADGDVILKQVMEPKKWQDNQKVPLRYKLIGMGFLKGYTLEELNASLMDNFCRPLYPRNSFECTLCYAFSRQMSYQDWNRIVVICEKVRESWREKQKEENGFFLGKKITFGELKDYVLSYSDYKEQQLLTKSMTRQLENEIEHLGSDLHDFFKFFSFNLENFSDVHEKARYYFCKYLYYHLQEKIKNYTDKVSGRAPFQEELVGLLPLKAESVLRRKVTKVEKLQEILNDCAISPAALFEDFNYYFFGYVSVHWVELLLENISDINDLTGEQIEKIATYLRKYLRKKTELCQLSDIEIVRTRWEEIQKDEGNMETGRKGENTIRKYLRGELDLDRTTLICFLLYLGSSVSSRNEIRMTKDRLDTILDECGFSMLRTKEPFDDFVIKYIESKDPVSYMMLEMDKYLQAGEPFFVYEMYSRSGSNAKEIRKLMGKGA